MKYIQVSLQDWPKVTNTFWTILKQFHCSPVFLYQVSTENGMEISIAVGSDKKWEVVLEAILILLEDIPYTITDHSQALQGFGM